MSFDENPIVDDSSERSEASELAVRKALSRARGFICREDVPDYGVDLLVELVINGQASGLRFPVQIKSARNLPAATSDDEECVAHQFATSRLGYLCRCPPAFGLVVLYDDSTGIAYFDFVEQLYDRLSARKEPAAWQRQKTVRIHVPATNRLTAETSAQIHGTFRRRFENHALLLQQHGPQFGIPLLHTGTPAPAPKDSQSAAELLRQFGTALVASREFHILANLIRDVPYEELEASPTLTCVAAIGYSAAGRLLDAEHFIKKAERHREDLDEEECVLLDVHKAEVDFQFGRVDAKEYIDTLSRLGVASTSATTQLGIAVKVDYLCVLLNITSRGAGRHDELLSQLDETETAITSADLEPQARYALLLGWAGNLHQLAMSRQTKQLTALRVRRFGFRPPSMGERAQSAMELIGLVGRANACMEKVFDALQKETNEDVLKEVVPRLKAQLASTFFSFTFNSYMINGGQLLSPDSARGLFDTRFRNAVDAYNGFLAEGTLGEAHSALNSALEIGLLCQHVYSQPPDGFDEADLEARISELSQQLGKPEWVSVVRGFLAELPTLMNPDSRGFSDVPPERDRDFASEFVSAYGLPDTRIDNIVADIRASREFVTELPDANAELLQDLGHTANPLTMYAEPLIYTGACMRCGFRTSRSHSVQTVIAEFVLSHGRSCPRSS